MSAWIDPLDKLNKKIIPKELHQFDVSRHLRKSMTPKMPEMPEMRRAATIDDAAVRQQETDRLSRRRGVLANIWGGKLGLQPTVAVKQLLGH